MRNPEFIPSARSGRRPVKSLILVCLLTSACATTPGGDRLARQDPLEGVNRAIWGFNRSLDKAAVKPVTQAYRTVTPVAARRGATNAFNNVREPFSFINAILQGKIGQAARTFARFAINTTIGVGGLADHASGMGLKAQDEDFGQTLGVWGVNAGPYVVLPFFGPSTLRDSVGFGIQLLADPYRVALRNKSGLSSTEQFGVAGFEAIDLRSQLIDSGADGVLDTSADSYATARSAYLQYQAAQIRDGEGIVDEEGPAIEDEEFAPLTDETPQSADETKPAAPKL